MARLNRLYSFSVFRNILLIIISCLLFFSPVTFAQPLPDCLKYPMYIATRNIVRKMQDEKKHVSEFNKPAMFQKTPLSVASFFGDSELVKILLGMGVATNAVDARGGNELLAACEGISQISDDLRLTVEKQSVEIQKEDEAKGGSARIKGSIGEHPTVIKMLLDAGVDVRITNEDNGTPLIVVASIYKDCNENSCAQNCIRAAELILEKIKGESYASVYVNAADKNGFTALRYAVETNNPTLVKLLCHSGAEVNRRYEHGFTVLMIACLYGYTDVEEALIENGADPTIRNERGYSSMDIKNLPAGTCTTSKTEKKDEL